MPSTDSKEEKDEEKPKPKPVNLIKLVSLYDNIIMLPLCNMCKKSISLAIVYNFYSTLNTVDQDIFGGKIFHL